MMESTQTVEPKIQELMDSARNARQFAYCPYSKFRVGASVLCEDGSIYTGVNVENASYGLTVCAERVAVMKAVSDGYRQFKAVAVACDIEKSFKASCGACRQFLAEFGLNWDMYLVNPDKSFMKVNLEAILPMAFTPGSLEMDRVKS